MTIRRKNLWGVFIAILLSLLLVGSVLAYLDRTTLEGYTIDFVEVSTSPDGQRSTWVYAVTSSEEVPPIVLHKFGLGLGNCYEVIYPLDGSVYTTPVGAEGAAFGCGDVYTCTQGIYAVDLLTDVMPGMHGVRYEMEGGALSGDNLSTHIFSITLQSDEARYADTYVGLGMGAMAVTDTIMGPVCAPTTVTIAALDAHGQPGYWGLVALVGVVVLGLVWRRL